MSSTASGLAGSLVVAVLIGAILPLQGLINARLGSHIGGPVVAAFASFVVGGAALATYLLVTRTPITLQGSLQLPPWIWVGGLFCALYVACFTLLIPRIGAAGMICLAVLGQVVASLLLDRFGILQAAPKPVDGLRILGAVLVLAGVLLVVAPWRGPVASPASDAGGSASPD